MKAGGSYPAGGRFELEKLNNMLHRKQCKNLDDLPAAIDILQKDFRNYSTMMGTQFPTEWKIPLRSQLLPDAHRENLKMQYLMGQRDFEKMCDSLNAHANEHRLTEGRGRKDMEVDAVDAEIGKKEYTEEEWTNYIDTLTAQIEEINYMGAGKGWKGGK